MELKKYLRVVASTGDDDDDYSMVEISNRRAREAADRIEKLEAALRETLSFVETYSYRWDGFNETHPAILLDKARKALEKNDV